jgi:hypothetical protein
MPSMLEHESNELVKVLVAADSSSGKTGSMASLVDAGFNLRVLDYDNNLGVLKGYVKDKTKLANVHYVNKLQDSLKLVGGRVGIAKAPAFQRGMDALDKGGEDYWGAPIPPLMEWTPRDILCVDTLSMAGRASLQMVMQVNAAGFKQPEIQHYGTAMENIERWFQLLMSDLTPCHVIVNTHITGIESDARLYPDALGSKLPPKLGKHCSNMIGLRLTGGSRKFLTQKDGLLALKTAVPLPETLPIETGWITIFETLTGKKIQEIGQ